MESINLVVCVGAGKAGTTTLHALMGSHPEVGVTRFKETNFFFDESLFSRGRRWYLESYFPGASNKKILFEADPIYMLYDQCIARIQAYFRDAKIVVMLRHPVDLAFSLYNYRSYYARHTESFIELCRTEAQRIALSGQDVLAEYGYLARGRYASQIENIFRHFPREQVYFIVFEHFIQRQREVFMEFQEWLGLTPIPIEPVRENETGKPRFDMFAKLLYHPKYRNTRKRMRWMFPSVTLRGRVARILHNINFTRYTDHDKPRLDPVFREELMNVFRDDIKRTQALTGLDLSIWK